MKFCNYSSYKYYMYYKGEEGRTGAHSPPLYTSERHLDPTAASNKSQNTVSATENWQSYITWAKCYDFMCVNYAEIIFKRSLSIN